MNGKEFNPIEKILEKVYHKEHIATQSFEKISNLRYKASVQFPAQTKSKIVTDHVSNAHIAEAITELLYAATATAIDDNSIDIGFSVQNFLSARSGFFVRSLNIKFVRILRPFNKYNVEIEILTISQKKKFYEINYRIKGSFHVKTSGLFPINEATK